MDQLHGTQTWGNLRPAEIGFRTDAQTGSRALAFGSQHFVTHASTSAPADLDRAEEVLLALDEVILAVRHDIRRLRFPTVLEAVSGEYRSPQATQMSTPQATPMAAPPAREDATQMLPVAGRVGHVNSAEVAEGLEPRAWDGRPTSAEALAGEAWSGAAPGDEHRARTVEAMNRPHAATDATIAVLDQPVPEEPQRPARGRKARSS